MAMVKTFSEVMNTRMKIIVNSYSLSWPAIYRFAAGLPKDRLMTSTLLSTNTAECINKETLVFEY